MALRQDVFLDEGHEVLSGDPICVGWPTQRGHRVDCDHAEAGGGECLLVEEAIRCSIEQIHYPSAGGRQTHFCSEGRLTVYELSGVTPGRSAPWLKTHSWRQSRGRQCDLPGVRPLQRGVSRPAATGTWLRSVAANRPVPSSTAGTRNRS